METSSLFFRVILYLSKMNMEKMKISIFYFWAFYNLMQNKIPRYQINIGINRLNIKYIEYIIGGDA